MSKMAFCIKTQILNGDVETAKRLVSKEIDEIKTRAYRELLCWRQDEIIRYEAGSILNQMGGIIREQIQAGGKIHIPVVQAVMGMVSHYLGSAQDSYKTLLKVLEEYKKTTPEYKEEQRQHEEAQREKERQIKATAENAIARLDGVKQELARLLSTGNTEQFGLSMQELIALKDYRIASFLFENKFIRSDGQGVQYHRYNTKSYGISSDVILKDAPQDVKANFNAYKFFKETKIPDAFTSRSLRDEDGDTIETVHTTDYGSGEAYRLQRACSHLLNIYKTNNQSYITWFENRKDEFDVGMVARVKSILNPPPAPPPASPEKVETPVLDSIFKRT
ncbi:MAG: hypothetical protein FWD89_03420 [Firmicutes bacterium]|nr:hypothetical protein [Bacillota bacterium]